MDGYKHYIRIDDKNNIIKRFSDAFEHPLEADICVNENGGRHYNDPVINERGQYIAKWFEGVEVVRAEQELENEWIQHLIDNPVPKTYAEKIADLEAENMMTMMALVELHMMILTGGGSE